MKKRAIIYIRVSTDEQAEKGNSLKYQETMLTKYCHLQDIEVDRIYTEDYSAKTFDRPEFKKLLAYTKKNKKLIDVLLILKWDRFSRNASEAYAMLNTFDKLGIEVQAIEQPLDLSIPENKLMLAFYLAAPEVENDRRGMNTRAGMRRARKDGRFLGSAPFGYKNGRDEQNKPLLIPDEKALLVKEAFEHYATGLYAIEEVRKMMYKKGLRITRSRFPIFLRNVTYIGKVVVSAYKDEPEEIVEGIHAPIISDELFRKVQINIKNRGRSNKKRQYEKVNVDFPLRGLITCSRCGKILTGSFSKGRSHYYPYYHCKKGCNERMNTQDAHSALMIFFDELKPHPEVMKLYLHIVEDIFKENGKKGKGTIQKLEKQLAASEEKLATLDEKYVMDQIDEDTYRRLKPRFKQNINQLTDELFELKNHDDSILKYVKSGMTLIQNLGNYYQRAPLELKRKLVGSIFPDNLIYENGKFRTASTKGVLGLVYQIKSDFDSKQTKKASFSADLSCLVTSAGKTQMAYYQQVNYSWLNNG